MTNNYKTICALQNNKNIAVIKVPNYNQTNKSNSNLIFQKIPKTIGIVGEKPFKN